jgi:MerR family transcriptional regulator, light-induced transcriptional regulator
MKRRATDDANYQELGDQLSCEDWMRRWDLVDAPILRAKARSQKQEALLESLVAQQIIPRLLLAHPREIVSVQAAADAVTARLAECVGELSELAVRRDANDATAYFEHLKSEGVSIEALFQDLLAPTARRLGELWDEDIYDFIEVTRGLGVLQSLVHAYGSEFTQETGLPVSERRALLMPIPGEQHTFGVSLLGEQFRREGWRVWSGVPRKVGEITDLVKSQWFDVVGLSASLLKDPRKLAADVKRIRRASKNPKLAVFVGGRAFAQNPDLVGIVGADATATDAQHAVRLVEQKLGRR